MRSMVPVGTEAEPEQENNEGCRARRQANSVHQKHPSEIKMTVTEVSAESDERP
jgi:hypothetical protein